MIKPNWETIGKLFFKVGTMTLREALKTNVISCVMPKFVPKVLEIDADKAWMLRVGAILRRFEPEAQVQVLKMMADMHHSLCTILCLTSVWKAIAFSACGKISMISMRLPTN